MSKQNAKSEKKNPVFLGGATFFSASSLTARQDSIRLFLAAAAAAAEDDDDDASTGDDDDDSGEPCAGDAGSEPVLVWRLAPPPEGTRRGAVEEAGDPEGDPEREPGPAESEPRRPSAERDRSNSADMVSP